MTWVLVQRNDTITLFIYLWYGVIPWVQSVRVIFQQSFFVCYAILMS